VSERPDCACEPGKCGASAAVALLGRRCKAPSAVDRDALLEEAVALLDRGDLVSHTLQVADLRVKFMESPSLAAWRREMGK
jgi:hypothetical protein